MSRTLNSPRLLALAGLLAACNGADKGSTVGVDTGAATGGDDGGTGTDDTGTEPLHGCTTATNPAPLGAETCVEEAPCRWEGEQSYEYWGYALDAGWDVDGDGREDMVVGAPTFTHGTAEDAGRATLVSGAHLAELVGDELLAS